MVSRKLGEKNETLKIRKSSQIIPKSHDSSNWKSLLDDTIHKKKEVIILRKHKGVEN